MFGVVVSCEPLFFGVHNRTGVTRTTDTKTATVRPFKTPMNSEKHRTNMPKPADCGEDFHRRPWGETPPIGPFLCLRCALPEACSRTLDFAFADAACAAVARRTRRVAEAEELQQRSRKAGRGGVPGGGPGRPAAGQVGWVRWAGSLGSICMTPWII